MTNHLLYICCMGIMDNSYPRPLVPRGTRTQGNSYPGQLVPKTTRTQDNSYPRRLVPRTTPTQDNSYPRQLVPRTTRTLPFGYYITSIFYVYSRIISQRRREGQKGKQCIWPLFSLVDTTFGLGNPTQICLLFVRFAQRHLSSRVFPPF